MRTHLALLSLFFIIFTAFPALGQNPVQNPGFESGTFKVGDNNVLSGWKVRWPAEVGEIIYSLDSDSPHSGKYSFKM